MDPVIEVGKAFDRYEAANEDWQAAVLHLAETLARHRARFPSNQEFGAWLASNELDRVNGHARAALIGMGSALDLARLVLQETKSRSLELIWRNEMQPRLASARNTTLAPSSPAEQPASASPPPESPVPPAAAGPPADPKVIPGVDQGRKRTEEDHAAIGVRSRSPLRKYDHFDLVHGHHLSTPTRTYLGHLMHNKRSGPVIWKLLIHAIQTGAFGPPIEAHVSTPNLRLILPWAPIGYAGRFDLTKKEHLEQVAQRVLPAVLAHPEIRHTPERLGQCVQEVYEQARHHADQQRRRTLPLPEGQRPVIVYGEVVWPAPAGGSWTYNDVVQAWWFVDFLLRQFPVDWNPESRTIQIHALLKWMRPTWGTGWAAAVRQIATFYRNAPTAACEVPPAPTDFGA